MQSTMPPANGCESSRSRSPTWFDRVRPRGLPENAVGHVEADGPVRRVDNLADAEIAGDTGEHVGVDRGKGVPPGQKIDHATYGVAGRLMQVGSDAGGDLRGTERPYPAG